MKGGGGADGLMASPLERREIIAAHAGTLPESSDHRLDGGTTFELAFGLLLTTCSWPAVRTLKLRSEASCDTAIAGTGAMPVAETCLHRDDVCQVRRRNQGAVRYVRRTATGGLLDWRRNVHSDARGREEDGLTS